MNDARITRRGGGLHVDTTRCMRCGKIRKRQNHEPFCSYDCQEWYGLESAHEYARGLRTEQEQP